MIADVQNRTHVVRLSWEHQSHDKISSGHLFNVTNETLLLRNVSAKQKKGAQPMSILTKYAKDFIFNNFSTESNKSFMDINKRRLLLRQDLQQRKVIHLEYKGFQFSVPSFASDSDKELMFKNQAYAEHFSPVPQERLIGAIAWLPNVSISRGVDCGWGTTVEEFRAKSAPGNTHIKGILSPLLVPDSFAFQHFIDGVLPKLIQAYEYVIPEDVKLLIHTPRDNTILEMYEALGFKRSQLVYYKGMTYSADVMINSCIAPPLHPEFWQIARRMLGVPEDLSLPVHQASVILLTRARQRNPGRTMTNSKDVLHFLLHRYGSSNVVLFQGGYNLTKSIDIFRKAKIIIGVHGGALYNVLYAPKGTHLIEIMPTGPNGDIRRGLAHTIFWSLTTMLEQPYWRVCEKPLTGAGNVQLNISKLKTILDKIDLKLGGSSPSNHTSPTKQFVDPV